ncbi:MAG: hypothetical protein ABL967_05265 [Bryobacteraceae bacterium]
MKRWVLAAALALAVFTSGCAVRANYYRHGASPYGYGRGDYRRGYDERYRGDYRNDGRYRDRDHDRDGYRDGRYERWR